MKTIDKTVEGNATIAKFMDGEFDGREWVFNGQQYKELKYHSSWDWQIPAWSKLVLGGLKGYILSASQEEGERYNRLMDAYYQTVRINKPLEGFELLVEAIDWYNNQSVK